MRLTRVALAAVLTLGVAACGEDEKKPDPEPTSGFGQLTIGEIRDIVVTDMKSLSSVHVVGTFESTGEEIDLRLDQAGNCTGTVTNQGGTAEVIEWKYGHLVRADRGYWDEAVGEEESAKIPDADLEKWRYTRPSLGYFEPRCEFAFIVDHLPVGVVDQTSVGEEREIGGVSALPLVDNPPEGDTTTLWVSTQVPHYVVRIEQSGEDAGTLTLSEFDEPVVLPEPDPSDVINIEDPSKKAE